jgi:HEPN domain-containing protein
LPRKTDANEPADWLWISEQDLQGLRLLAEHGVSFHACRSKLAEVLEKVLKAELIRLGWPLEKTHDLQRLRDALVTRSSDLAVAVKPLCDGLAEAYMVTRYPGFDLDDPDWPTLRQQVKDVEALLATVKSRLPLPSS